MEGVFPCSVMPTQYLLLISLKMPHLPELRQASLVRRTSLHEIMWAVEQYVRIQSMHADRKTALPWRQVPSVRFVSRVAILIWPRSWTFWHTEKRLHLQIKQNNVLDNIWKAYPCASLGTNCLYANSFLKPPWWSTPFFSPFFFFFFFPPIFIFKECFAAHYVKVCNNADIWFYFILLSLNSAIKC